MFPFFANRDLHKLQENARRAVSREARLLERTRSWRGSSLLDQTQKVKSEIGAINPVKGSAMSDNMTVDRSNEEHKQTVSSETTVEASSGQKSAPAFISEMKAAAWIHKEQLRDLSETVSGLVFKDSDVDCIPLYTAPQTVDQALTLKLTEALQKAAFALFQIKRMVGVTDAIKEHAIAACNKANAVLDCEVPPEYWDKLGAVTKTAPRLPPQSVSRSLSADVASHEADTLETSGGHTDSDKTTADTWYDRAHTALLGLQAQIAALEAARDTMTGGLQWISNRAPTRSEANADGNVLAWHPELNSVRLCDWESVRSWFLASDPIPGAQWAYCQTTPTGSSSPV